MTFFLQIGQDNILTLMMEPYLLLFSPVREEKPVQTKTVHFPKT